jgi:plastocyanin
MHSLRTSRAFCAVALLTLSCASAPPAPAPGRGTVFGELRLVPHAGVTMPTAGGGTYGDPRLRDTKIFDYSRPGFAVVYLESGAASGERVDLAIRANEFETRLEPRWLAVAVGGTVTVKNATSEPHTVSCPSLGRLARLGPGESLELSAAQAGLQSVFLLDRPQVESGFFAAPGPYVVLSQDSRFELRDLPPGKFALHAWHPRLPPVERSVDVVADQSTRIDLEMGVGVADNEGAGR